MPLEIAVKVCFVGVEVLVSSNEAIAGIFFAGIPQLNLRATSLSTHRGLFSSSLRTYTSLITTQLLLRYLNYPSRCLRAQHSVQSPFSEA